MRRLSVAGIAAAATLCWAHSAVRADPPQAASGYVGKGQTVLQTAFGSPDNKLSLTGNVAFEQRTSRLRIDILSLGIPGAGTAISGMLSSQFFPRGGFTVVYNRSAGTYSIWSTAKRTYYTGTMGGSAPSPAPAPSESRAPATLEDSLKNLNTFTLSLTLAGRSTVNGHPATGFEYQFARTLKNGDATDLHGRIEFADDLDGLPVQLTAALKTKSVPESTLRVDLSDIVKRVPPETDFQVPAGYTRAATLAEVMGKALPR